MGYFLHKNEQLKTYDEILNDEPKIVDALQDQGHVHFIKNEIDALIENQRFDDVVKIHRMLGSLKDEAKCTFHQDDLSFNFSHHILNEMYKYNIIYVNNYGKDAKRYTHSECTDVWMDYRRHEITTLPDGTISSASGVEYNPKISRRHAFVAPGSTVASQASHVSSSAQALRQPLTTTQEQVASSASGAKKAHVSPEMEALVKPYYYTILFEQNRKMTKLNNGLESGEFSIMMMIVQIEKYMQEQGSTLDGFAHYGEIQNIVRYSLLHEMQHMEQCDVKELKAAYEFFNYKHQSVLKSTILPTSNSKLYAVLADIMLTCIGEKLLELGHTNVGNGETCAWKYSAQPPALIHTSDNASKSSTTQVRGSSQRRTASASYMPRQIQSLSTAVLSLSDGQQIPFQVQIKTPTTTKQRSAVAAAESDADNSSYIWKPSNTFATAGQTSTAQHTVRFQHGEFFANHTHDLGVSRVEQQIELLSAAQSQPAAAAAEEVEPPSQDIICDTCSRAPGGHMLDNDNFLKCPIWNPTIGNTCQDKKIYEQLGITIPTTLVQQTAVQPDPECTAGFDKNKGGSCAIHVFHEQNLNGTYTGYTQGQTNGGDVCTLDGR